MGGKRQSRTGKELDSAGIKGRQKAKILKGTKINMKIDHDDLKRQRKAAKKRRSK